MSDDRESGSRPAAGRSTPGFVRARLDELEVTVERLVSGGDGLARYQGIAIFVARSAPGDRLRVRLTQRRPGYGRAEIVEILEPGSGRREPPCEVFERCGGCDLQHLEDGLQTELKAEAARETLERLGRIELPADIGVISGAAWGYRLRTRMHVAPGPDGAPRIGYFERGSHSLVPVEACPVCLPQLEDALPDLVASLSEVPPQRIDLACGDDGRVTAAPVQAGFGHGPVTLDVDGLELAYDARCFFQTHRPLLADLVACVLGERDDTAAGEGAPSEEESGRDVFDLYGGVGLFATAFARRSRRVVLVEVDRIAARYARMNARRNRLTNLEVVNRSVEAWVGELPSRADRVVVDPPRAGLSRRVRSVLLERLPRRLTYASCHPATMARDLGELVAAYEIDGLTFLDLFPQTGHMEAVVQLTSRAVD